MTANIGLVAVILGLLAVVINWKKSLIFLGIMAVAFLVVILPVEGINYLGQLIK